MTYILVMVTTPNREEAEKIVITLLEKKLIACANILGPVSSRFWWQGKIDEADEYVVFMKTEKRFFEEVVKHVRRLHSYEIPEIIASPIIKGLKPYLKWISNNLAGE